MTKTSPQIKRVRLDMRFPKELLRWVQRFAQRKNKSVTQVFIDHVVDLKEKHGD